MAKTRRIAFKLLLVTLGILLTLGFVVGCANEAGKEEIKESITFADLGWDSAQLHNRIAGFIIENGYGYPESEYISGETVAMLQGVARGDIDVNMEVWIENQQEAYDKAIAANGIVDLGSNFTDAWQGWLVPTYMVEEGLIPADTSVSDMPKYWELFKDPEEPTKGRFINGVPGWELTKINTEKLKEYGLDEYYTDFVAGSEAALTASMVSSYKKQEPWFGYYWSPTWVLGMLDMTQISEPAYDKQIWDTTRACTYPPNNVVIVVNPSFIGTNPEIVEFLRKYETSMTMINEVLAYMQESEVSVTEAAIYFLKEYESVWMQWVSADVANEVKAALP